MTFFIFPSFISIKEIIPALWQRKPLYDFILRRGKAEDARFFLCDQMKFLLECVKYEGKVIPLTAGSTFDIGNSRLRVLWPAMRYGADLDSEWNQFKQSERVYGFIDNQGDFAEDSLVNSVREIAGTIERSFCEFLDCINRNVSGETGPAEREAGWESISWREMYRRVADIYRDQVYQINHLAFILRNEPALKWQAGLKASFWKLYKNDHNRRSIVFRTLDHRLLMTGDITADIIDKYLDFRNDLDYFVIKCPHHGTDSHFSRMLPGCTYLLMSNAKYKNFGHISEDYAACGKFRHFICTNGYLGCCNVLKNMGCASHADIPETCRYIMTRAHQLLPYNKYWYTCGRFSTDGALDICYVKHHITIDLDAHAIIPCPFFMTVQE